VSANDIRDLPGSSARRQRATERTRLGLSARCPALFLPYAGKVLFVVGVEGDQL